LRHVHAPCGEYSHSDQLVERAGVDLGAVEIEARANDVEDTKDKARTQLEQAHDQAACKYHVYLVVCHVEKVPAGGLDRRERARKREGDRERKREKGRETGR